MKKEIQKVPKYDRVVVGYEEKEVFVSDDGKKFDLEGDAIMHDIFIRNKKRYDEIKKFTNTPAKNTICSLSTPYFTGIWYYLHSREDLAAVVDPKDNLEIDDIETDNFQELTNVMDFPAWFLIETDNSSDYNSYTHIFSLPYIEKYMAAVRDTFPPPEER